MGLPVLRFREAAGAALALFAAILPAKSTPPELADKAAFLVKLAPFVDWPQAIFASPDSPLTICAMADDPLAPLLEQAANGQKDGSHPLVVRRIAADASAQGCAIFYFEPDSQAGAAIAAAVQTRPVLTATSADSGKPAAIVTFAVEENRLRFDIDNTQAIRDGLRIGSNLLALARKVTPGR